MLLIRIGVVGQPYVRKYFSSRFRADAELQNIINIVVNIVVECMKRKNPNK